VTLDGVIADTIPSMAPHASPEKWGAPYWDEEHAAYAHGLLFPSDALLLGHVTFEGFARSWPSRTGEFADRINKMPKYVASRTLSEPLAWNATLIAEDVASEVAKLKQQTDENILKYGTGELDHTLMKHNLVDLYVLLIHPLVLGTGRCLFGDGGPFTALQLVDSQTMPAGVVIATYQPTT
jgi:dihydrofolate reductase